MAHAAPARSGTTLGDYQVLGELGTGGMGTVLKAFDRKLERTVALKFLAPDTEGTSPRHEVLREARAASILDHKNIVAIHAVEHSDDGRPFLVMAYYEGESLAARMRRTRITLPEALDIVEQVGAGLTHAHAHGIVHRDIKPSNIILTADGTAKIVDFGLARHVSADASTQTLRFSGTLAYMSPEQVTGKPVDARTDVWSLGVVLYELLTGRLPFEQASPAASVAAIAGSPPAKMGAIPPALELIVYRALAKSVQDRYQSAAEMVHDLEALGTSSKDLAGASERELKHRAQLAARPFGAERRRTRRTGRWLAALAVLVVIVLLTPPARERLSRAFPPPASGYQTSTPAHESYLRGVAYLDRHDKPGNLDAAVKEFEATTTADPKFALAFAGLCESYWMKYRYESKPEQLKSATAACERAAELNDQLPAVYVSLGRIHNGTGERELALQELQRALALDGHNPGAWLGLGDTFSALGRKQEAEDAYKRAIVLRPEHWSGYYRLGAFYYGQQRFAEAADQFRKVIELAPDHGLAHAALGQMLMNLGRDAEAEPEFKRGLELAPNYGAYTNLGLMYYRQRRMAESAAMTEKALQLNDRDYRVWDNLGTAYRWLGEQQKADRAFARTRQLLEETVRMSPDNAEARADLGLEYAHRGRRKEAFQHLDAALALAPDDPRVLVCTGEAHAIFGEHAKAFHYIRIGVSKGYALSDLGLEPEAQAIMSDPKLRRALEQAQLATTNPPQSASR